MILKGTNNKVTWTKVLPLSNFVVLETDKSDALIIKDVKTKPILPKKFESITLILTDDPLLEDDEGCFKLTYTFNNVAVGFKKNELWFTAKKKKGVTNRSRTMQVPDKVKWFK